MKLGKLELKFHEGTRIFHYRPDSVGDKGVIRQIFENQDYRLDYWHQGKSLMEFYESRTRAGAMALIVDAGANIGASCVYFSTMFRKAIVFAIEPEPTNSAILKMNCPEQNIVSFEGAIGSAPGTLFLQDPGLSDWGFRVGAIGSKEVPVISTAEILDRFKDQNVFPLVMKIDIEGGESGLFEKDTGWVEQFPLIIIELHDWLLPFQGSSRNFLKTIAALDFDFVHRGENIFCFNRTLLV